jgi:hypothetical protein
MSAGNWLDKLPLLPLSGRASIEDRRFLSFVEFCGNQGAFLHNVIHVAYRPRSNVVQGLGGFDRVTSDVM